MPILYTYGRRDLPRINTEFSTRGVDSSHTSRNYVSAPVCCEIRDEPLVTIKPHAHGPLWSTELIRANMADKGEVHVLLVAFAAQGHLNPMLRFGKRLLSKGLRVTLATTGVSRQRLLAANKAKPVTSDAGIQFEFFSDGWNLGDNDKHKDTDMYMENLVRAGRKNLSELLKTLANNGQPVSCIVNNPFVPWVVDVAEEHGIPCAMLWIQPCLLYALYYRYYLGVNKFPDLAEPDVCLELPGLPLLHKADIPSFLLPSNPFISFPKILNEVFQKIKQVKWVLANSFYELEQKSIESMVDLHSIMPVGPLVPPSLLGSEKSGDEIGADMWKAAENCLDWLNNKTARSVVYISFGSLLVLSRKQMENLAWGLRNSGRHFLWVVKPSENGSAEDGELPPGFLEETADQGLVVTWCPQVKVLSHPSVGCFLTHCGWNSSLETIAAGVPVIAFPQWTDQPTNAKLLEDVCEMGLRLREDEEDGTVSKEEIKRCVDEMMEGPKSERLHRKALEWKAAARTATMKGGSSDQNIQYFVDHIVRGERGER